MTGYRLKNRGASPASDGTTTMKPGDTLEFSDVCAAVRFLNKSGSFLVESTPGAGVQRMNRAAERAGCSERVEAAVVAPAKDGEATDAVPLGGDTAKTQGAPEAVGEPIEVEVQHGAYGEPGDERTPTEALHDPKAPATEGQVQGQAMANGKDLEAATAEVERAARGDPPEGEPRSTHNGEKAQHAAQSGDPVDLYSGRLALMAIDLELASPFFELAFVRRYLSGAPAFGPFGFNWDHNWNVYLRPLASGDMARWTGTLHEDVFVWDGALFQPPRGVFEQLVPLPGQRYELRARHGVVYRFERPPGYSDGERIPLVEIRDRLGNRVRLHYEGRLLRRVEDDDGRFFEFHYGRCSLLEAVEDHSGRRVEYLHDDLATHLSAVREPATRDFPGGRLTRYEYLQGAPHPLLRHCIARIYDHDGHSLLDNLYQADPASPAFGRLIAQSAGGFVWQFVYEQVQWVPPGDELVGVPATRTLMKDPGGAVWTYTFNYRGDLLDERVRLVRDKSYRVIVTRRTFDAAGNLIALVRPDGSSVEWVYDHKSVDPRARGDLLRVELRAAGLVQSRIVLRASYHPGYQFPREITYETGAKVHLKYDERGDVREVHWPDAELPDGTLQPAVTRFDYDPRGLLLRQTSPAGRVRSFVHEPPGSPLGGLLREEHDDPDGVDLATSYNYDAAGHLSERTAPGGATWQFHVNALGQVEDALQPPIDGQIDETRYFYNAQGRVERIERPRGELQDAKLQGESIVDRYEWSPLGHLRRTILADNTSAPRIWEHKTDWDGRPILTTSPGGLQTRTTYDERGLVLEVEEGYGTGESLTTRRTYDRVGRQVREEDPAGLLHTYDYDAWGRLATIVDPAGTTTTLSYGPFDLPGDEIITGDPGEGPPRVLQRTRRRYDARGRLLRSIAYAFVDDPDAATALVSTRWLDADGLCVRQDDPTGASTIHEHDGAGRLYRTVDPLGNVSRVDFATDGLPLRLTDEDQGDPPMTRWTELHRDPRGRLVSVHRPDGPVLTQRWDARDLIVEVQDALGVLTQRHYDAHGELLLERVDPGGLDLIYAHTPDAAGREVEFIDPTGAGTTTTRDTLGRIRVVHLPGGAKVQHDYDAAGRLARTVGPDGAEQKFTYESGRLRTLDVEAPAELTPVSKHLYTFDGLGRLVRAQAGESDVRRVYDSLGRLRREQSGDRVTALEIDDLARVHRLVYPDGRRELHRLDVLGRVAQIELEAIGTAELDSGPPGLLAETEYLGPARLTTLSFAGGASTRMTFDPVGRLARVTHADAQQNPLSVVDLRHDRADRRRLLIRSGPDAQARLHDFDPHARLVELRAGFAPPEGGPLDQAAQDAAIEAAEVAAADAPFQQSWALTGADTPKTITTTEDGATTVSERALGPHHQVLAVDAADYPHDAAGRRVADPERTIRYDALGRVAQVRDADTLAILGDYAYDALGRLVQETRLGAPVRTLYFGPLPLHEELAGGEALRQYTHHPHAEGAILATTEQGPLALHPGVFGDLALVTAGGAPLLRYDYAVFGQPTVLDGEGMNPAPPDALGLRPRWGGMPYASEPGLYLSPARPYDPARALFLTPDPALHVDSPSPYTYCAHNPVDRSDPGGEVWGALLFGAIGAAAGVFQTWRSDPDADFLDLFVAGAIGFSAGFIGAATFGWASAGITRGLLSVAGRSGLALGAKTSVALSVTSGVGAGAVSGGLTGGLAGAAGGFYEAKRYGGDTWEAVKSGALREGISGMAAGAVGGGLFQGILRAGVLPRDTWAQLHKYLVPWVGQRSALLARGIVSPYGVGGVASGFAAGFTGGAVRHLWDGGGGGSLHAGLQDGLGGALFGALGTAMNPTTYRYWAVRSNVELAHAVEGSRGQFQSQHHQRNVARYPELNPIRVANPTLLDRVHRQINLGNVQGPDSLYQSRQQHLALHRQWRFGQSPPWSKMSTHGPWTPPWTPAPVASPVLPSNHQHKEE